MRHNYHRLFFVAILVIIGYSSYILFNHIQSLKEEVIYLNEDIKGLKLQIMYYKNFNHNKNVNIITKHITKNDKSKRILITGGAGFVGYHLVNSLLRDGHDVIVIDNLLTGRKSNIKQWLSHPKFEFIHHDIVNPIWIEVDEIYHLASPASPPVYMKYPIKTIKANILGTINMLGLAKRNNATILLASSSEIYGDPTEHPQNESYSGNVKSFGPRSCYDEGKRLAESLCYAYWKQNGVSIRIARIFNTFGPKMRLDDGRVVSNFIRQALLNEILTIHGNGSQTRSFQYVSDLIDGLRLLMASNVSEPVNIGNPVERSVLDFAKLIKSLIPESPSRISFSAAIEDDPHRRQPDISRAKKYLNWRPKVDLIHGLRKTIDYFRNEIMSQNFV